MSVYSSRYGVITDLHSNLAAVRAVLDALRRDEVSTVLCPGDVVGYGPSPCEVIDALSELPLKCIRGNHDRYALGENSDQIRTATAEAVEYTRQCLRPSDRAFLGALQDSMLYDSRILLVHGSLRDRDEYILSQEAAVANYRALRTDFAGVYLCLFGHTHLPTAIGDGKVLYDLEPGYVLKLRPLAPYLINPGSVGQPRDGNPDAAYGIVDLAERTVTFKRVAYDVEDTCRRIAEAGLQRHLADRLRVGK